MLECWNKAAVSRSEKAEPSFWVARIGYCVACLCFSMPASPTLAAGVGKNVLSVSSKLSSEASCGNQSVPSDAPGCLISLLQTDKLKVQQGFSLVDVRSPADFDRYRIAGSINIPLHLVKTKTYLKKLPIVLVNEGRSTVTLEKACGELRQAGFEHVSVLDGGLLAWYVGKRPLDGNPAEHAKLDRMSAEELLENRGSPSWSVIDASRRGKHEEDIRSWLPEKVIAVPYKAKGDSISQILSAVQQQRKKYPHRKLLLIADDNGVYERVEARLKKLGGAVQILYLDGGMRGYRAHIKDQIAIWNHLNELNQPRRYTACPG